MRYDSSVSPNGVNKGCMLWHDTKTMEFEDDGETIFFCFKYIGGEAYGVN